MASRMPHASSPAALGDISYNCDDSTHFLSNSFPSNFQMHGHTWPTVLHYFISRKFGMNNKHMEKIQAMTSPIDVHMYSRDDSHIRDITAAWNADKKSIMKEALRAKFEQNVVLRRKLLNTANRLIIEVSQDDTYWSQLADGSGRNIMGTLLSQVRSELETVTQNTIKPAVRPSSNTAINLLGKFILRNSPHTVTTPSHLKTKISPQKQDATINSLTADFSLTKLTDSIHFFHADPLLEYSELSTFYVSSFYLEGKQWSSVQHYFQAQKYATGTSQWLMDRIRTADSPRKAYELGTDRKNSHLLVIGWDSKREGVMMRALRAKFSSPTLKRILLSTGDRHLAHDSTEDFWGVGRFGKGKNRLGQLLITLRKELTETSSLPKHSYQPSHANSLISQRAFTTHTSSPFPNTDVIKFYEGYKPYYEFTPYSRHSVMMDGVEWPTLNHYFQAQKYTNQEYRDEIMRVTTPQRATYLAESFGSQFMKPLTTADKRLIMEKGLIAKLTQHPEISQSLISTGNKPLLFVHPTDLVWGTGSDMKGLNMLGELLMKLRIKLHP